MTLFYGFCPKNEVILSPPPQSNPQLQPSKSKLFHQKLPLGLEKKTPLQTNQPTNQRINKKHRKKKHLRFVFTPKKETLGNSIVLFFSPSPSVRFGVSNGSVPKRRGAEGTKRQDTAGSSKACVILLLEGMR